MHEKNKIDLLLNFLKVVQTSEIQKKVKSNVIFKCSIFNVIQVSKLCKRRLKKSFFFKSALGNMKINFQPRNMQIKFRINEKVQ